MTGSTTTFYVSLTNQGNCCTGLSRTANTLENLNKQEAKKIFPTTEEEKPPQSQRVLHRGKYRHGKYIVSPAPKSAATLIQWITSGRFSAYEKEQFHLSKVPCRPRNKLYSFHLPEMQQEVVMKVSHINPSYRLSRKIDLFLTSLYKDYCKISFHGALALDNCNLPVATPLAFWTVKQGFFKKESYFLSSKLPGEKSVCQMLQSLERDEIKNDCHALSKKLVTIIRNMHAANLRHGDLHTGNFYINFPQSESIGQPRKISNADLFLLDYDSCSNTKITIPWIKKIYDLKDLSLLAIPGVRDEELLEMYFNDISSPGSLRVFRFWKNSR